MLKQCCLLLLNSIDFVCKRSHAQILFSTARSFRGNIQKFISLPVQSNFFNISLNNFTENFVGQIRSWGKPAEVSINRLKWTPFRQTWICHPLHNWKVWSNIKASENENKKLRYDKRYCHCPIKSMLKMLVFLQTQFIPIITQSLKQ